MGIKNLSAILNKYCLEDIVSKNISEYKNKKIAVDLSIYLHRYYATQGNILTGLYYQVKTLLQHNILPIYVIDGKATSDKDLTLRKRRDVKEKIKKELDQVDDSISNKDTFALHNRSYQIKDSDIEFCKKFFDGFGIPYIQAEQEADNVCVHLAKSGQVDGCLSEDLDFLAQGCPLLLRDFKNKKVVEYRLDKILSKLDINFNQFQDMCIMCGSDYLDNIPRIGALTSYKLIKQHLNIENILIAINNKYVIPKEYDYQKVRSLFNCNIKIKQSLKKKDLNKDILINLLQNNNIEVSETRINKIILEIKKKEKLISSFFI